MKEKIINNMGEEPVGKLRRLQEAKQLNDISGDVKKGIYKNFDPDCFDSGEGPSRSEARDWEFQDGAFDAVIEYLAGRGLNPDSVRITIEMYVKSKGDKRWALEKVLKKLYLEGKIDEYDLNIIIDKLYRLGLIGRKTREALKAHAEYLMRRKARDAEDAKKKKKGILDILNERETFDPVEQLKLER